MRLRVIQILLFILFFSRLDATTGLFESILCHNQFTSGIIVKQENKRGEIINIGSEYYEENIAPKKLILGKGVYEIIFSQDSLSFSESWVPFSKEGVGQFKADNISVTRWIKPSIKHIKNPQPLMEMLEKRFTARLIESIVEKGLLNLGYKEEEVKADIILVDNGSILDGHFVKFMSDSVIKKYISGWKKRTPSKPHKSLEAYNSPEIFHARVLIVLYDGRKEGNDIFPDHIGLIRSRLPAHIIEAISAITTKKNLARSNAFRVRNKLNKSA